jgi:hypothetical protein
VAGGWITTRDVSVPLNWPATEHRTLLATWRVDGVPLALLEDQFIVRTYLCSAGHEGSRLLHRLVEQGVLQPPRTLLDAARHSVPRWAELGDTLYDLVAGCIDPDRRDVFEVWGRRLADHHPLIRLAASWTGPYLATDEVAVALEALAAFEDEPQVRAAAARSASAIRQRSAH